MNPTTQARRCKPGQLALVTAPWPVQCRTVRILHATRPEAPYYLRSPWLVESQGGPILGRHRDGESGTGSQAQIEDRWLMPLGDAQVQEHTQTREAVTS